MNKKEYNKMLENRKQTIESFKESEKWIFATPDGVSMCGDEVELLSLIAMQVETLIEHGIDEDMIFRAVKLGTKAKKIKKVLKEVEEDL